jgi:hypothetical protein
MAEVSLTFKAENEEELVQLVLGYAAQHRRGPSWLGKPPPPTDPEMLEDMEKGLSDEEWDAKYSTPVPAEPTPEPEPAPKTRKPRAARPAVSAPEPEPAPAPAPAPAPPARELPALETLKAVITTAVRLAQKGEGSKKILELLPAFKDATGLDFVMNAEDRHRAALYDLVSAADLPVV